MNNPDLLTPGATVPERVNPLQALTAPLPATEAPSTKYYICTVSNACLHRADGKKLPFVFGFLETAILHDQKYLDAEIDNGNPYVRAATKEEVTAAKMRMDPKGTIRAQVESELRADLEAQIRAELLSQMAAAPVGSAEAAAIDGSKVAGVDAASKLAAIRDKGTKTGTATVMESTAAPLQGVVGSDKIAAGAKS